MTGAPVLSTVRDTIRRHHMLDGGETVLVAVSGGADSTALLHVLSLLASGLDLRLQVLHVDHGLRPESSADAAFVRDLAGRYGLPVDVATVTVDRDGSLEAAARTARYAALDAHADRIGAQRIALGHTADDQAETVLMRVLEGTGVRGLAGIPAMRGRIVRPLLDVRRGALVDLLRRAGLAWIEDPSNRDPRFARNRIRHEVLPQLAAAVGGDVVPALTSVARQARNAADALEQLGRRQLARLAHLEDDAIVLPRAALGDLPRTLGAEVLRQASVGLGGRTSLRAWEHRGLTRALATPPPRRPFRLGGISIDVSGDRVRLGRATPPPLRARLLPVPGMVALAEIDRVIEARLLPAAGYAIRSEVTCAAFDADDLPLPLSIRGRLSGDRFVPFGGAAERRLKTVLIDAKVPRWQRDRVPLVIAGGAIVWVGGVRRGAAAPVTAGTRRVLELALKPLAEARAHQ